MGEFTQVPFRSNRCLCFYPRRRREGPAGRGAIHSLRRRPEWERNYQPLTLPSPAAMLSETQNNGDYGNSKYLSLVMFDPPIPLSKEESFSLKISALFSVGVPDSVV